MNLFGFSQWMKIFGATVAVVVLSSCNVKMLRTMDELADLSPGTQVEIPELGSVTITDPSPTNLTALNLVYTNNTSPFTEYCIRENDPFIFACTWVPSATLPSTYTPAASNGPLELTVFLKNSTNNISTAVTSNSVILDRNSPSVLVTAPNGGETWSGASTQNITWTATDVYGVAANSIALEYSDDGGTNWTSITTGEANDGTYAWTVPTLNSNNVRVRVLATDVAGNTGSDFSNADFTIATAGPTVAVTAPNGGEFFQAGALTNITWTATDMLGIAPNSIVLQYSTNAGATWTNIATGEANDGTYAWTTPSVTSAQVRVRVTATNNGAQSTSDASNANFTIDGTPPVVAVTSPNGGEIWAGGSTHAITWTATDTIGVATNSIALEYSTNNGGAWTSIATGEANDGTYSWTVPAANSTQVLVRVTAADTSGNSTSDASNAAFTIDSTAPAIAVTSPNGGEIWAGGSARNITWTATDGVGVATNSIALDYSTDNGSTWTSIATSEANDGTYSWTVPSVNTAQALVRVTAVDTAGNSANDASNAVFTIDSTAPSIAVTSPNGGEIWAGGSTRSITWTATDGVAIAANSVSIDYSTNGGTTWTSVATGEANDGSYSWTVPSVDSTQVRVRVTALDTAGNSANDASDANFEIDSTPPALASVTVTNSTPTTVRDYVLTYGTITGPYAEYCIRENNTAVGGCVWTAGTLPWVYEVSTATNAKVLSFWLRDTAGNVSVRRDANSVTYTPALALTPATFTAALSNTATRLVSGVAMAESVVGNDGKVYLFGGVHDDVGGTSGMTSFANVYAYNPTNEQIEAKAPMASRRNLFQIAKLSDGRIWVGGGLVWDNGSYGYLKTAEIYDPTTNTWSRRKDIPNNRYRGTATRFTAADGTDRIALIGGKQDAATTVSTIYIYNPLNDTWSTGAAMSVARSDHSEVLLPDGRIAILAGMNSGGILRSYGIYDPAANTWTAGANSMAADHTKAPAHFVSAAASGLAYDSIVIFGGGYGTGQTPSAKVDRLRLDTGAWSALTDMPTAVGIGQVVALGGDKFLSVGGATGGANHATTVSEFDLSANTWTAKAALPNNRGLHTVALLGNGKVVCLGGVKSEWLESLPKNYLYTQGSPGSWAETGHFHLQSNNAVSVKLTDGRVLRCGGYSDLAAAMLRDCFLFEPATNSWSTVGKMATARKDFSLTLLPNGNVLAAGGGIDNSNGVTNTAEIYDATTRTWSSTGSFTNARRLHKAVLLADNDTVLIAGGNNGNTGGGTYFPIAQKYSISGGTWSSAGTMNANRGNHVLVRLNDGRVFANGGFNSSTTNNSSEIYDPATNTWTAVASSAAAHGGPVFAHTGTGANERVYVSTGFTSNGGSSTNVTEYYDVTTNTWVSRANMPSQRWAASYFLSEDGFIYVFGGSLNSVAGGTPTSTVYRYSLAADTWTAITSINGLHNDILNNSPTSAQLLDDGRVVIGGFGNGVRSSEIYSFVTTQTFTATGGDLNYTLSLFSGIGTFYPESRLYVPHSADFSARGGPGSTTTRVQVLDGEGYTDDSDITIP